ncbi:hypothetical protein PInf_021364 [Phytophthora infestans]|nr:hypothetical protein PInf_021364 [Phytophthora infestans]
MRELTASLVGNPLNEHIKVTGFVDGLRVETLNLEEMTAESLPANLKTGEIAEMVLIRPEAAREELNSSSVLDEASEKS